MDDPHALQRWEDELGSARFDEAVALKALADGAPALEDAQRERLRQHLADVRKRKRTALGVLRGLVDANSVSPAEAIGCSVC